MLTDSGSARRGENVHGRSSQFLDLGGRFHRSLTFILSSSVTLLKCVVKARVDIGVNIWGKLCYRLDPVVLMQSAVN